MLAKLKNPKERKPLIYFTDEKNFQQDQKVKWKNNRWLCENADEVPIVMKTKYPGTVKVFGVVSNEGNIMSPHFLQQELRVNAVAYLDVLQNVFVP